MHQAPALAIHLKTAAANRAFYGQLASGICAFSCFDSLAFIRQSVGAVPRAQPSTQGRCILGSLRHI